jgi:hypothetical protein
MLLRRALLTTAFVSVLIACPTFLLGQSKIQTWRLGTKPTLELGAASEDSVPEFLSIEAVRYDAGRNTLVVVDRDVRKVSVFNAKTGSRIRTFGRKGKGPGELDYIAAVSFIGDTIAVADGNERRTTYWLTSGRLLRVQSSHPPPGVLASTGIPLGGGDILFIGGTVCASEGRVVDSAMYVIADSAGGSVRNIGRLYRDELWNEVARAPDGKFRGCGGFGVPHSAQSSTLADARGVWYAEGRSGKLVRFSRDGKKLLEVQVPVEIKPVSATDKAAHKRRMEEMYGGSPDLLKRILARNEAAGSAANLPAVASLARSEDGGVWVSSSTHEGEATRTWFVVTATGKVVARIDVPADVEIKAASDRLAVGVRRDEMGGQRILLYEVMH